MKALNQVQTQMIAGGCDTCNTLVTVAIPSTVQTFQIPANANIVVTDVCTNYNVITPVYDSFGILVGSVVDSYQTCTPII